MTDDEYAALRARIVAKSGQAHLDELDARIRFWINDPASLEFIKSTPEYKAIEAAAKP